MLKCRKCGKSRLFLKLHDGLCRECREAFLTVLNNAQRMADAVAKEFSEDGLGEKILNDIKTFGSSESIPVEYDDIASLVAFRTLTSGERPAPLAQELVKSFPELDYSDIYSAMLTKCSIASSARVKFRALQMGMDWYIWRTARDGDRVREAHRMMEGVVCNWNDPPNPERLLSGTDGKLEHPGYAKECRCIALPVISFDDIQMPAKVHFSGAIREITTIREINSLDQMIRNSET